MLSRANLMSIAVIYATTGRSDTLKKNVNLLGEQSRQPNKIVISCARHSDASGLEHRSDIDIILGDMGLPKQRNTALNYLGGNFDIVIFFDDDFLPHHQWIENVEKLFFSRADVTCVTGYVVADGIKGPGIEFTDGVRMLQKWIPPVNKRLREGCSPYGCNMAFRHVAIRDLYFDEKLPLYGWQEDRDFGATVASKGGLPVMLCSAGGVHLGVKSGRTSGVRLGYSQIINPMYLLRKGTMSASECMIHISKNLVSNLVFSLRSEPYIDRKGRLLGNFIAIGDLLKGRIEPEKITRMG